VRRYGCGFQDPIVPFNKSVGLNRLAAATAVICLRVVANPKIHAQPVTNWNVSTGDWTTSGNWDNGVPNPSTQALIGNNGTATISASDTAFALAVYVGRQAYPSRVHGVPSPGEPGTLLMSGGTLTVSDGVQVGGDGGFTNIGAQAGDAGGGTLTISSGALTVTSGGVNVGGNGGRAGLASAALAAAVP